MKKSNEEQHHVHTGYGHGAKKSMGLKKFSKKNFSPETSFFKPKKSLGQNFLKSEQALNMMCEAGTVGKTDTILEIGPGKGALTSKLLEKAGKVIAIEKDRDLIAVLEDKFEKEIKSKKLELVEGDCLKFDPSRYSLSASHYKLIANIPYNITGAIIKRFLSEVAGPSVMVLLVQKEVAMRIVATDKKESILSLSVKAYGTPKYIMKVGKRFFSPSPKVDSAIVAITGISKSNFAFSLPLPRGGVGRGVLIKNLPSFPSLVRRGGAQNQEEFFFTVVKAGFAHKRKMLIGNLETIADKEVILASFKNLEISTKTRAEDLSFQTWLKLADHLGKKI